MIDEKNIVGGGPDQKEINVSLGGGSQGFSSEEQADFVQKVTETSMARKAQVAMILQNAQAEINGLGVKCEYLVATYSHEIKLREDSPPQETLQRLDTEFVVAAFDVSRTDRILKFNWLMRTGLDLAMMARQVVDGIMARHKMVMLPNATYQELKQKAGFDPEVTNEEAKASLEAAMADGTLFKDEEIDEVIDASVQEHETATV